MAFRRVAFVKVAGPVDQPTLDQLRARLGLSSKGRLSDEFDEIFGDRVTETAYGPVRIQLLRYSDVPGWRFDLHFDGQATTEALIAVEPELDAAISGSGLAATEKTRLPE